MRDAVACAVVHAVQWCEAKAVARVDYQTNITLYSDSMLYVSIKVMLNRFLSPGGSEQSIVGRS